MNCCEILGPEAVQAMARARDLLQVHSTEALLDLVGQTRDELALPPGSADKRHFAVSYGGGKTCDDDVLAGSGMFYVTQAGKVMLDCVGGHYQLSWGYNHPLLTAALRDATDCGIVWDNHANTPSLPVKKLADRLAEAADGSETGLNRVLLGLCTGSVACEAALKIMLIRHSRDPQRASLGKPVMLALTGNYHGTSIVSQAMRGMWKGYVTGVETVEIEPNDTEALRAAFAMHGRRIAGFWCEPVMMNREATTVDRSFLNLAQQLCTKNDAVMAIDEIQTGFWYPETFLFRRLELSPDIVVIGKGLTAGFHPLAGLIYREDLDLLEQYDAISTNGNASLAAYLALCNLSLIERERERIEELSAHHSESLRALGGEFPDLIETIHGHGLLSGLKFRTREDALGFHRAAVKRGLWLRVHAYHEGHRTVLTKYPLVVERKICDFVLEVMRELLAAKPWRSE
ncbi:MAG: aminotransferase class III-fold pyridoxal phosphate-dependent enzyme [Pirellulaceae bacterium]|nr:aminotransferase class III-fold pyridoxal phosphate-dependent enzyme [Pirellulaceae bacterium]